MPFQVLNPMEAMQVGANRARANRLADIQEADIIRGQREREMLNQLYQQAYNKQTGNVDFNQLYGGLAAQGMGTAISGIQKSQADLAKTQAETLRQTAESGKISGETITNRMNYWRSSIPSNPAMAANWVAGVYSDPVVSPILNKIGTADQVIKTIPKDPVAYQQWAQEWSMGAQKFNEAMRGPMARKLHLALQSNDFIRECTFPSVVLAECNALTRTAADFCSPCDTCCMCLMQQRCDGECASCECLGCNDSKWYYSMLIATILFFIFSAVIIWSFLNKTFI